jgi:uncharacterized protein (TIGR03067 family)
MTPHFGKDVPDEVSGPPRPVAALSRRRVHVGEEEKKKETNLDTSMLLGDWVYVSGMMAGVKSDKDKLKGTVTFKKGEVLVPTEKDGKFTMGYTIDTKATPAAIDLVIKDGPFKDSKAQGIIELKD